MSKRTPIFQLFCSWVGIVNHFYYPRRYYINRESIPADGNSIIMVGNHQNCMMDPVNVELALSDRKSYSLTRGDLFRKKNLLSNFLFWIGLLPVNRIENEGFGNKSNAKEANRATFTVAAKRISQGNTLIVFPEAMHQNKRWLGYFSFGYLHIAFQTAELMKFEKEVYIVPFAHHYGNYFYPLHDFVLRFGTPIALSTYYEQYKTKPRTTMRQVNDIVESQIRELMLNISDLDHYTSIDALREGPVGKDFAIKLGLNPRFLTEKQLADKQLVEKLAHSENKKVLDKLQAIETEIYQNGMNDDIVAKEPGFGLFLLNFMALLSILPLFINAFMVTWPVILAPRVMDNKVINGEGDEMFRSTWNVGITTLITLPLFWILPTIILCFFWWKIAILFFLLYPLYILIVLLYCKLFRHTRMIWNFVTGKDSKRLADERNNCIKNLNLYN